jgi:prophage tail gpP-like protein
MTTIQEKLLAKYEPVTLTERDIGKKFIFVYNDLRVTGTFDGFVNNNRNYVRVTVNGHENNLGVGRGGFIVFRVSDIRENILNKTMPILPEDMIYEISHYGGLKSKRKSKRKSNRKSNRKHTRKSKRKSKRKNQENIPINNE